MSEQTKSAEIYQRGYDMGRDGEPYKRGDVAMSLYFLLAFEQGYKDGERDRMNEDLAENMEVEQ